MTDRFPSVTIVAGTLTPAPGPVATFGHMLRMHDAGTYIHIDPETARQWLTVLTPIAESENNA